MHVTAIISCDLSILPISFLSDKLQLLLSANRLENKGVFVIRIIMLIIIITLTATACGRNDSGYETGNNHASSNVPSETDQEVIHLKDTVGNPDALKPSDMRLIEDVQKLADEYGPRTGRWFEGENGFNIISSYSSGEREAGSTVSAGLSEVPEGRSVRFQLTSRDEAGKRKTLISEYVTDSGDPVFSRADFNPVLPTDPNVNYLVSIEILGSENVVEDTFLSAIYVPHHELNARLSVESPAAGSQETKLSLYNAGPTNLYFGKGYSLYSKAGEDWKAVNDDRAVISIGISAKPGETYEEVVTFPYKMPPGQYRLVKNMDGFMTDLSVRLAADFELK